MPLPHLDDVTVGMTLRGLIFWGIACTLGVVAVSSMAKPDAPVLSLEMGLGAEVQTTRL